jgi:hypothetical protein
MAKKSFLSVAEIAGMLKLQATDGPAMTPSKALPLARVSRVFV